jgi:hypothetical protein
LSLHSNRMLVVDTNADADSKWECAIKVFSYVLCSIAKMELVRSAVWSEQYQRCLPDTR